MARLQQFAGGAFGAGGTIATREVFGEAGTSRFRQPSVLFGLGTGAAAAALWWTNKTGRFETPVLDESFWGSHAATALPAGALYAALPAKPGATTTEQVINQINESLGTSFGSGSNGGGSNGNNGGTESVTVRRANSQRTTRASNGMGRSR